jgi:uncharacterized phage-associated protein
LVMKKLRFRLNWDKAIEAIALLGRHQQGITQYYVSKVCYFADKEHMLDYGRPITGDRYVAMEHGPVPSSIRDLLNEDHALPDDVLNKFHDWVSVKKVDKLQHISPKNNFEPENLSGSDIEYLLASLKKYGKMSFAELRELSHDEAWEEAWEVGTAYELNFATWLKELGGDNATAAVAYLSDRRVGSV